MVHSNAVPIPSLHRMNSLPQTLYIQLDNCARENNKYFFGYCAVLVKHKVFKEVSMYIVHT